MVVLSRSGWGVGSRELGVGSQAPGVGRQEPVVVRSLDEAMRVAAGDEEVFVIGGGEIFELTLTRVNRMYVTWVEAEVVGDVTFPEVDWGQWREISSERLLAAHNVSHEFAENVDNTRK